MPFYNERRLFKRNREVIQKPLQIILLSGVLLFGFVAHFFDAELGAQYDSKHEQAMSRFAFAPRGFDAYLADKMTKDRHVTLTRASMEMPLTGSIPNAASANLLIITSPGVRNDDDSLDRVRIIDAALSVYSKAPAEIASDGVNMPESRKSPGTVKAARVQEVEPHSATASWLADEPSKTALKTMVKLDQDFGKARLQPKVTKLRRVSRRSRRPRARAKRPSIAVGQPLYRDLPKWARAALFNSGS